jgi:poly(3-hydroxybutyrate) depolymerase
MTSATLERGYYVSAPTAYDANTPYALVFGYHGSNYTGKMMRTYLDNEKAPLVGKAVFVYPDGLPLPDQPDNVAWVLTEGSRDMVFFDDMMKAIGDQYCIDYSKVLVNGQSFGGLMTNALGCLRGDVIRAIAVVAGSGPRGTCKGQVAAWLTHGTDDDSVSFASGEKSRDFWVQANHCTTTTMPGTPAQCQVYQGCDAGYPVIWCPHTADGGHQHPSFGREAVRQFFGTFL